jgi:hypothetical protein
VEVVKKTKESLVKIVASRVARLKAEGERLFELCSAFGGQLKPTALLPPELRTDDGFVVATEELELPCGSVVKVLGLEKEEDYDTSTPEELYIRLVWGRYGCSVWVKKGDEGTVEVDGRNTKALSTLSVSVLVRYAKLLGKMIESVRQRVVTLEEYERQCAERLTDEIRGMLAEDAVS